MSGKKSMHLLPMGSKTEKAWRMINEIEPAKADALAASAFRYALTGGNANGPGVPPTAWQESKGEIDLLLARRAAGREGGLAKALATGVATGQPTGQPTLLPSSPLPSSDVKPRNQSTEDEEDSSLFPPGDDFAAWAFSRGDAVKVALAAAGEKPEKSGVYGQRLKELTAKFGRDAARKKFVEECVRFKAEIDAGERVGNPGAALVTRLKSLTGARVK